MGIGPQSGMVKILFSSGKNEGIVMSNGRGQVIDVADDADDAAASAAAAGDDDDLRLIYRYMMQVCPFGNTVWVE